MEGTYEEIQASDLYFAKSLRSSAETTSEEIHKSGANRFPIVDDASTARGDHRSTNATFSSPATEARPEGNSARTSTFFLYLLAGGPKLKILFFVFICIFTQVSMSGGDIWLTYWYKYLYNIHYAHRLF